MHVSAFFHHGNPWVLGACFPSVCYHLVFSLYVCISVNLLFLQAQHPYWVEGPLYCSMTCSFGSTQFKCGRVLAKPFTNLNLICITREVDQTSTAIWLPDLFIYLFILPMHQILEITQIGFRSGCGM